MVEHRNSQYTLLFVVFLLVMTAIGILNRNVARDISVSPGAVAPAAVMITAEEKAVKEEAGEPMPQADSMVLAPVEKTGQAALKKEETQEKEPIYELPLPSVILAQ